MPHFFSGLQVTATCYWQQILTETLESRNFLRDWFQASLEQIALSVVPIEMLATEQTPFLTNPQQARTRHAGMTCTMSELQHFRQSYYQRDLRAFLTCSEISCELDLAEPISEIHHDYHLEVLHQPTDKHGWPQGRPRSLYETDIIMKADRWSSWSRGYCQLPFRLTADLLRQCHLRLTAITMASDSNTDHIPNDERETGAGP